MHSVANFLAIIWLTSFGQSTALKNVLMLMMDDFRPEVGVFKDVSPYFNPKINTPNIDKLAGHSLVLKNNYCQVPRCNPSRQSLLTARRPENTIFYDTKFHFRDVVGNFTTLPEYFKDMGYQSIGIGKIFHYGKGSNFGDPPSWSVPHFQADNPWKGKDLSWHSVTPEERAEKPLQDDTVKERAIEVLQNLSKDAAADDMTPFFLAVGFHKPHLPFISPKEYFDQYPLEEVELPKFQSVPSDFPEIAWSNSFEVRGFHDVNALNLTGEYNTTLPDEYTLDLRRAYYAAVSYVDALIGEVVDELENLGLASNTVVAFLSDHGFLLGEHGHWAKNSLFEETDIVPMMIRVPGFTDDGIVTWRLTEQIDLYPTLVELAGLPQIPLCPDENPNNVTLCRQGTSFVPLILDPEQPWKPYVFTMYPQLNMKVMGYSVRSEDGLRYTNWVEYDKTTGIPNFDSRVGEELYNHTADSYENVNLVVSNDLHVRAVKRRMRRAITKHGWKKYNPEMIYDLEEFNLEMSD